MSELPTPGTLVISVYGAANTAWNVAAATGGLQPSQNEPHFASRRQNILPESDFPEALEHFRERFRAFNKLGKNTRDRSDINTSHAALPNFHSADHGQGRVYGCHMFRPGFFKREYVRPGKHQLSGEDVREDFAYVNTYARRHGYVGAFPTFDETNGAHEIVLLSENAAIRETIGAATIGTVPLGVPLVLERYVESSHEDNFPVSGTSGSWIVENNGFNIVVDVPLHPLDLFRRLDGYAREKGYATAIPTYLDAYTVAAVDNRGQILTLSAYEVVFIKHEAVKWLDIHWEVATVLGSTVDLMDTLVHSGALPPGALAIDVPPWPDEFNKPPLISSFR